MMNAGIVQYDDTSWAMAIERYDDGHQTIPNKGHKFITSDTSSNSKAVQRSTVK